MTGNDDSPLYEGGMYTSAQDITSSLLTRQVENADTPPPQSPAPEYISHFPLFNALKPVPERF